MILAGAASPMVIFARLLSTREADITMQVKSETGSALNLNLCRLQFSALKKKNAPPAPSMLSARVSA